MQPSFAFLLHNVNNVAQLAAKADSGAELPEHENALLGAGHGLQWLLKVQALANGKIFPKQSEPGAWTILEAMALKTTPADFNDDPLFVTVNFQDGWKLNVIHYPSGNFELLDPQGNKRVAVSYVEIPHHRSAKFLLLPRYEVMVERSYKADPGLSSKRLVVVDHAQKKLIFFGRWLSEPRKADVADFSAAQTLFRVDLFSEKRIAEKWLADVYGRRFANYFTNNCWAAPAHEVQWNIPDPNNLYHIDADHDGFRLGARDEDL